MFDSQATAIPWCIWSRTTPLGRVSGLKELIVPNETFSGYRT